MTINKATPQEWDRVRIKVNPDYVDPYDIQPNDPINSPSHYNSGDIECIDAIEASMSPEAFKGYLKGNVEKYVWRMSYKGKPVEDLRKARFYLDRLISAELGEPSVKKS